MASDPKQRVLGLLAEQEPMRWGSITRHLYDVPEHELEAAIDDLVDEERLTFSLGADGGFRRR